MSIPKVTPVDVERAFTLAELFFSTTDRRGVITSGNEIFARVAAYESVDELLGRPHNIIRHPDMPRAVFQLLWDTLEAGRPFAGYVKNMARDGGYYWVVAVATPIDEGYLSVRFKPSGPHLEVVREIYAEMRAIENAPDGGDRPARMAASGAHLSARLAALGFPDYSAFMNVLLPTELVSRRRRREAGESETGGRASGGAHASNGSAPVAGTTGRADLQRRLAGCRSVAERLQRLFDAVEVFSTLSDRLLAASGDLHGLADSIHLASMNGLITASRQGSDEGLAAVMQSLSDISRESNTLIRDLSARIADTTVRVRAMAFDICAARLMVEMSVQFAEELLETSGESEDASLRRKALDLTTLVRAFSGVTEAIPEQIPAVRQDVRDMLQRGDFLTTALRRLPAVQVTGRIMAAHGATESHFVTLFATIATQMETARQSIGVVHEAMEFFRHTLPELERAGEGALDAIAGVESDRSGALSLTVSGRS